MSRGRAAAFALAPVIAAGLTFACAGSPPPPPTSAPMLEEGTSLETAVLVEAADESSGVAWENDWIWRHYGRFRKKQVNVLVAGDRRFDAIEVELADHTQRTLYFDITGFFGK